MTSQPITRAGAIALILVLFVLASPCAASFAIDLPQLLGTHEQSDLSFQLTIPRFSNPSNTHLQMSGYQIVGIRADCSQAPYEFPAGSTFKLVLRLPSMPDLVCDTAAGELPANDGQWTASVPLVPALVPTLRVGGTFDTQFVIGEAGTPLCCYVFVQLPVVTINEARIVTDGTVDTEAQTWGSVKRLFQ